LFFDKKSPAFPSMKKLTKSALWVLSLSIAALFSCNDPTVIGSDLLSGDQLDIEFTDTVTLKARTVLNDSMIVWRTGTNSVLFSNFAFGDFQDPVFGRTVASIYTQFVTNTSPVVFDSTSVLDSVVLIIPYNSTLAYGNVAAPFTMEVYEMSEDMVASETYINSDSFAVNPMQLAAHTFTPNFTDSITVMEPNADTVRAVKQPAHLRIKLDTAIFHNFLELDSASINNDSSFLSKFKGLWLKPGSQNAGLLNFNMRSTQCNLRFYYREEGTKKKSYDFHSFVGNPIVLHQRNYYGGGTIAPYISQAGEMRNDSFLFIQGLNGVNIELEIPYAEDLKGIIINKAELVFPIVKMPGDDTANAPVAQLYASEIVTDDSSFVIDDIYLPIRNLSTDDYGDYFGGKATSDDEFYKMALSAHLQKMIAGNTTKKIRFTVYFRSERAARVVLGGPSSYEYPAKLNISYTRY
jgi:Domain of unknown function (DUF4270)